MAQYIDKDALVAEIERVSDNAGEVHNTSYVLLCNHLKDFLDTLEVKEDNMLTEKKIEKELAKAYINIFDKKFGNKLPNLKSKQLAEFKNFINTCEQTFHMKYFDYHAMQGKLFEKLALLWAVWGKEHLTLEVKEVDLDEEIDKIWKTCNPIDEGMGCAYIDIIEFDIIAKHFFELGMQVNNKAQKGE